MNPYSVLGWLLRDRRAPAEPDVSSVEKALVVSLQGIGDYLMTTPLIHELAKEYVVDALVLKGEVREVTTGDVRRVHVLCGALRTWLRVREEEYDLVFLAHGAGPKSGLYFRFLPALLKASHTYDLAGHPTSLGADIRLSQTPMLHRVEENLKLLDALGFEKPDSPSYHVSISDEAETIADAYWDAHELRGRQVVGIHPGGDPANPQKRYPLERYIDFARRLSGDQAALFFLGPAERWLEDAIRGGTEGAQVHIVKEDLSVVAALLGKCDALVHSDSMLGHLAAAADTRTVTLAGATNYHRTRPYGERDTLLVAEGAPEPAESCMEEPNIVEEPVFVERLLPPDVFED